MQNVYTKIDSSHSESCLRIRNDFLAVTVKTRSRHTDPKDRREDICTICTKHRRQGKLFPSSPPKPHINPSFPPSIHPSIHPSINHTKNARSNIRLLKSHPKLHR